MKLHIDTVLTKHGFTLELNTSRHPVVYPETVWEKFPKTLQKPYSELIAFMTTIHYAFRRHIQIQYHFPAPLGESFFMYALILAMPENLFDYPDSARKTSDYLRYPLNSFYKTIFTGHTHQMPLSSYSYSPEANVAILPFSFGKDSLLTYALCKELGIKAAPFYMIEENKIYENNLKLDLINKFRKEFGAEVHKFRVPLQELRQKKGMGWGWDTFLTQYTMFLIPFLHFYKAKYFFWSNEYDRNFTALDREGYLINQTFDQSGRWMQSLNTVLRLYGVNAKLGSLIDSLSELGVIQVLHTRYPSVAKYQTSCLNEADTAATQRWCGKCEECAKVYVFLIALGIDPQRVDFRNNLLQKTNNTLFPILFAQGKGTSRWIDKFPYYRDEKLWAFYLIYKRGLKGRAINVFKKRYFSQINQKAAQLSKTYMRVNQSLTTSKELFPQIRTIFQEELKKFK